jgi:hypothetical protein
MLYDRPATIVDLVTPSLRVCRWNRIERKGRPTDFYRRSSKKALQFCRQSRPTQPGTSREPRPSANAHLSAGTTPQRLFGAFSTRRSYLQTSVPRKTDGDEIIVAVTARQRETRLRLLLPSSSGADHRVEPSRRSAAAPSESLSLVFQGTRQ